MSAPSCGLLQATRRAAEAASVGDLAALAQALEDRGKALACAAPEELAEAFAHGEAVAALLRGIQQRLASENSRLEQMRNVLRWPSPNRSPDALIDFRG